MHRYICTYILWIFKYVTKIVGCGTSHKYTNVYNLCIVKYYRHFYKTVLHVTLLIKIHLQSKKSKYFLKAALNFSLSFLRIVRLGAKLLTILMPA